MIFTDIKQLLPIMNWKDIINPNPPQNLRFERLANGQGGIVVGFTANSR
jgi:hypothetical protein